MSNTLPVDLHLEIGARDSDSAAMLPFWEKVHDIVLGEDAVKGQAEKYLPKFADEDKPIYENRLSYAKFTNVYRDIAEALAAKPFEEEVSFVDKNVGQEFKDFAENVDGGGNNLTVFASQTFFNGINAAVDWIFVDFPALGDNVPRTLAEEKAAGRRPYWSRILAQNVYSVKSRVVDGKDQWIYFRHKEPGTPNKFRVYERDALGVQWQVWREELQPQKHYVLEAEGRLQPVREIPVVPFVTGRRDGKRYFFYPPMRDAADLQMNLYRSESGLEWLKVQSAYPMLAGEGVKPHMDGDKIVPLKRGPGQVLYAPPDGNGRHGSWKYVEPSAENMRFLKDDIKATTQDLRELGRQPLTAQSGQLTVITTTVAAGKARSAVSAWALMLKDSLENAMRLTAIYMGINEEPEINVYNEFDNFTGDDKDDDTLNTMRAAGDLSQETYWAEMKRRRVLSPEFNADTERQRLLNEEPGDENLDNNGNPVRNNGNNRV